MSFWVEWSILWAYPWMEGRCPRCSSEVELDVLSPPIIARDFVSRPLLTGNKMVDTLIPIGKGQRQLLIGDNGLGKELTCDRCRRQPAGQECSVCLRSDRTKAIHRTQYDSNAEGLGRSEPIAWSSLRKPLRFRVCNTWRRSLAQRSRSIG